MFCDLLLPRFSSAQRKAPFHLTERPRQQHPALSTHDALACNVVESSRCPHTATCLKDSREHAGKKGRGEGEDHVSGHSRLLGTRRMQRGGKQVERFEAKALGEERQRKWKAEGRR